jgi:hypothetical protein
MVLAVDPLVHVYKAIQFSGSRPAALCIVCNSRKSATERNLSSLSDFLIESVNGKETLLDSNDEYSGRTLEKHGGQCHCMELILLLVPWVAFWLAGFVAIKTFHSEPLSRICEMRSKYALLGAHVAGGILFCFLFTCEVWLFGRFVPEAGSSPLRFSRSMAIMPFLALAGALAAFYYHLASGLTRSFMEASGLKRPGHVGAVRAYFLIIFELFYMWLPFFVCCVIVSEIKALHGIMK